MKKQYTAHIISHSHWDREWYITLEEYRVRLVDMVDHLLDTLEQNDDFRAFMLDGHTALVEDYLAVKPENEERLARQVRAGRILIGPWYILPDQVLISGESHVRNRLLGRRICRKFGGEMMVGYAPDAFGHPAQLPQIYKQLGLGEILFWRGLPGSILQNEFLWQGPDGTGILGVNLPFGYGNCPNLPDAPEPFLARIENVVEHYAPLSASTVIPIMNGRDHLEAQPHIPAMAKAADAASADIRVLHSTLPEFVAGLRSSLAGADLPRHAGALYQSGRIALLEGTLSTRMYLKQQNQRVEDLYEQWAEPFSAAAHIAGKLAYPRDLLRHGWRFILQNQPHDSICGCSVDEVHREMEVRFASARQIGDTLLDRALHAWAGALPAEDEKPGEDEARVTVFNPSPYARTGAVKATVDLHLRLCNALVYEHLRREQYDDTGAEIPMPTSVTLVDDAGVETSAVLEHASIEKVMRYYTHTQPHEFYAHRLQLSFVAEDVPAVGYKSYRTVLGYGPVKNDAAPAAGGGISVENEFFRLTFAGNGIDVLDKRGGRLFQNCGALADDGDAGDEYLFSGIPGDVPVSLLPGAAARVTEDGVYRSLLLEGLLRLPCGLAAGGKARADETVDCPVTIKATLNAAEPRVDFETTFQNLAENHRLRAVFETDVDADGYDCDNIFCVEHHRFEEARPAEEAAEGAGVAAQAHVAARSQKCFTSVAHADKGVTVANRGLPEVEVRKAPGGAQVCLTLLRCVGIVANGNNGLSIPAPEGQCIGRHVFAYSFIPHEGGWLAAGAHRLARHFTAPLAALQTGGAAKTRDSMFRLDAPELVLSAFKQAEDLENTFMLRFYNTTEHSASGTLELGFPCRRAYRCNMLEEKLEELEIIGGAVAVTAGPYEVVTLALSLDNG